jgi:hypothetical protein
MTSAKITAAAAGTWTLGDLPVNRMGFGAMRLTGSAAFHLGAPSDRARSIAVLRRAVELGVDHIDTAAFYFSALRSANEPARDTPDRFRDRRCPRPRRSPRTRHDLTGSCGAAVHRRRGVPLDGGHRT